MMLILFKSSASADILTLEKNGREMLAALGRNPEITQGIVTVEQLPEAIARLRAAIDADLQLRRNPENTKDFEHERAIGFSQRGLPLLDLMRRSLSEKVPVIWES